MLSINSGSSAYQPLRTEQIGGIELESRVDPEITGKFETFKKNLAIITPPILPVPLLVAESVLDVVQLGMMAQKFSETGFGDTSQDMATDIVLALFLLYDLHEDASAGLNYTGRIEVYKEPGVADKLTGPVKEMGKRALDAVSPAIANKLEEHQVMDLLVKIPGMLSGMLASYNLHCSNEWDKVIYAVFIVNAVISVATSTKKWATNKELIPLAKAPIARVKDEIREYESSLKEDFRYDLIGRLDSKFQEEDQGSYESIVLLKVLNLLVVDYKTAMGDSDGAMAYVNDMESESNEVAVKTNQTMVKAALLAPILCWAIPTAVAIILDASGVDSDYVDHATKHTCWL